MPEDEDNEFDLDLDLGFGNEPEPEPEPAPIPQPASPPPAARPASAPDPVPAVFRKRAPDAQPPPEAASATPAFPPPAPIPQPDTQLRAQAQLRAQQEAQLKAQQQQAQLKAQQGAQLKAQQQSQLRAQQEAQLKAQQQAQLRAQQQAQSTAQQQAQLKAQQEAQLKAQQQVLLKAQQEAQLRAQQQAQLKAQHEAQLRAQQQAQPTAQQPQPTTQPTALPQKRQAPQTPPSAPAELNGPESQPRKPREQRKRRTESQTPQPPRRANTQPSEISTTALLRKKLLIGIPVLLVIGLLGWKIFGGRDPKEPTLDVEAIQAGNNQPTQADPHMAAAPKNDDDPSPVDRSTETPDERYERAENTLANFFGASKKEAMLEYVRHPLRVADLMVDYYGRKPFEKDIEFLGLKSDLQEAEAIGPGFYAAEADVGTPRSRTMVLEDTPKGFRIDWEYYVQYNPMDWSTFIKEAPTPPNAKPMNFRVVARIVPDYRSPFTDEERYLPVQMTSLEPNDTTSAMGYVERESELGKRVFNFLDGKAEELCILRLQFPGDSRPGDTALFIRELVNPHWIITDETIGN